MAMPQQNPQPPSFPRWLTLGRVGWALAAFFIILWGLLLTQTNHMRGEIVRSRDQVTTLSRDLATERRWSVILNSPSMRTASFTPTPDADPSLRARAVLLVTSEKQTAAKFINFAGEIERERVFAGGKFGGQSEAN